MGHNLYREILDGAPPAWTAAEHLVALVIADDASDSTRRGWIPVQGRFHRGQWQDGLCERTGLSPRGIRDALQRLGARGYEMRVAISKDKHGRPVFATRGHSLDFYVPPLPPRGAPQSRQESETFEGQRRQESVSFETPKAAGIRHIGGRNPSHRSRIRATPLLSTSPQHLPSSLAFGRELDSKLPECVAEERERFAAWIVDTMCRDKRRARPFLRKFTRADLLDHLARFRAGNDAGGKPPWCGHCDEQTRQIDLSDGRVTRCPHCHPLATARPADRDMFAGAEERARARDASRAAAAGSDTSADPGGETE